MKIETGRDITELAERALQWMPSGGRVALSGGQTYADIYPVWARRLKPPFPEFFPVDERKVPLDHPDSNWRMVKRLLLDPLPEARSLENTAFSARQYETLLDLKLGKLPPVFDACFLGLGTDGHTASLFPGQPYPKAASVLETESPAHPHRRVTLSALTLCSARVVVLVVSGSDKKEILQRVVKGDAALPASQVLARRPDSILIAEASLID